MAKLYCSKVSHNPYKEEMITEITEKVFEVDGYSIADRLLEGVLFNVYFENGKVINVVVNERQKEYFSQFNTRKFLKKVKDYAQSILDEGDEVDVPNFIKDKYYKNGINVSYITPQ